VPRCHGAKTPPRFAPFMTYPAVSPHVVAAGGTMIHRKASGTLTGETAWSGSGGGPSAYEARPHYQDSLVARVGSRRGAPDVSFDADPNSGVAVYDSTPCQGLSGWLVFGGTSVAAPSLAGVFNLAATSMRLATSSSRLFTATCGPQPSRHHPRHVGRL